MVVVLLACTGLYKLLRLSKLHKLYKLYKLCKLERSWRGFCKLYYSLYKF